MIDRPLATPEIQGALLSEAILAAKVGFLVWDDDLNYIAANPAAREILHASLDELLGQKVGGHSRNVQLQLEEALRNEDLVQGTAEVEAFDGSGTITVYYATFRTVTAGMPYMATLIAPVPE
jgi:PAS domain-containing protein